MGYPYNKLIAPAILRDNPGITKEQFIELLDQTHSTSLHEYEKTSSWSSYKPNYEDMVYHNGLEGLANLLNLKLRRKFNSFTKPRVDEHGLRVRAPELIPGETTNYTIGKDAVRKPQITLHKKNVVEKPKRIKSLSWDKLKIGEVWEHCMGGDRGIVLKIIKEKKLRDDDEDDDSEGPKYEYTMIIRPFHGKYEIKKYESMEEVIKEWPQFDPLFKYDFEQEKGHFSSAKDFLWEQKDGRYYLNPETFNKIPESFRITRAGYTDLILTAEAIKYKAWKLLSRRGLKHLEDFLNAFSDSRKRYDQAIKDSHTSLYAKGEKMTLSELLRMRVSPY